MKNHSQENQFIDCAIKQTAYRSKKRLHYYYKQMFRGVPLNNKRVLDVGGGVGLLTMWAAVQGAKSSLCIEPETDGSSVGMTQRFGKLKECAGLDDRVKLLPLTLQKLLLQSSEKYDVIMMANSINHLDENSVVRLRSDKKARNKYLELLTQLYEILAPGGCIVITDCSHRNIFGDIGLRNPIMKTIEWKKHQSPYFWDKLFQQAGFPPAQIQWRSPMILGGFGRVLLRNRLGAYFTTSLFRMFIQKPN